MTNEKAASRVFTLLTASDFVNTDASDRGGYYDYDPCYRNERGNSACEANEHLRIFSLEGKFLKCKSAYV